MKPFPAENPSCTPSPRRPGLTVGLCIALGAGIGAANHNLAAGVAMGAAIGAVLIVARRCIATTS